MPQSPMVVEAENRSVLQRRLAELTKLLQQLVLKQPYCAVCLGSRTSELMFSYRFKHGHFQNLYIPIPSSGFESGHPHIVLVLSAAIVMPMPREATKRSSWSVPDV